MSFFDFHLHPAFKKAICNFETSYPSVRTADDLTGEISLKNFITNFLEEEFLHILESQSCINQLSAGNVTLGVAAIAPIEEVFTSKTGIFGKMLNSQTFIRPVDAAYFTKIRDRDISYYQLFIRELNLYKTLRAQNKVQLLSRKSSQPAHGTALAVAFGIEGGHSLCRTKVKRPGEADVMNVTTDDAISRDFALEPRVVSAAESLRRLQQAMWDEDMDVCYLILTHLSHIQEQQLATHAYGIKMIKNNGVYPRGNGITQAGKDLIDAAYTLKVKDAAGNDQSATVLIDIKHMGLKSRLDLYAYRKEKGYKQPILASHMGVTGYSLSEWKAALEEATLINEGDTPVVGITIDRRRAGEWGLINKTFTFNAWSINMMDEDIEAVFQSGGMIGVSLDVRILGWQNIISKGDKEEILSWESFRHFFPEKAAELKKGAPGFEESFLKPTREERHPLALCFNILHMVWVGKMMTDKPQGFDPWKKICIGSDYDGLIEPLINCREATHFAVLEKLLLKWLPVADKAYCEDNSIDSLLPRTSKDALDTGKLQEIISGILKDNGNRFMQDWLAGKFNG